MVAESEVLALHAPVVCVVGPTASGKTDLAQKLAGVLNGEVVSADSMQIYRGMDIGTGKLPVSERLVPHHGFDLVDPGEPFSAALFQTFARTCFRDIDARGHRAVLCGGTGFYVRAALDGYDFPKGEQVNNPVREHYMRIAEVEGAEALWRLLDERDAASAALIPPADVKRVVRAFELLEDGTTYAKQRAKLASIPQVVPAVFVGLAVEPDVLRARIDARVDAMVEAGLVDEVRGLLAQGFHEGVTAPQAIGYKEIVEAFEGKCSLEEAIERIKVATHRYAKRQRTWFRKDKRIHWIDATEGVADSLAEEALALIKAQGAA
ncbi:MULTISPECIES: tRNA (adenosine(37)-N6)-dimethylallyltransferase MiaA [Gordonibacter]|uniref:tRNA dimethylallyltransferase n=1 Tax=Gordonibacter faecis TaxID=3047475 RepID=A0ABT7DL71_9ACTN|nr:tRNA (adenosine(37)-N6)-dimethylallyltransferase MiaA [Gordonibacter sp. KGMB12511]MDJ1649321.1 tRNA (adenosine(37)-N6)-dimethylallyltransferase MiaA [Gordonibacter sp. KGMB12511]HIW75212.1 tRNA (adenosine(37)-N6)-dimethylallyltransferase MiaA [Candidatus Gordonibacter avicola]